MKIKEYIGNKAFYKMTLGIAVPMMVQNLISNFVSLLDNVMVGALGTEDMSAVSIVNQLYFVFFVIKGSIKFITEENFV